MSTNPQENAHNNNGPHVTENNVDAIQITLLQMSEQIKLLREENEILRRGSDMASVRTGTFGSQDGDMSSMGVKVLAIIDRNKS